MILNFRYEPLVMFVISIMAATLGIFISHMFFPGQEFLLSIAFVVMVMAPVIIKYIEYEERELNTGTKPQRFLHLLHLGKLYSYINRHHIIKVCSMMFFGVTLTYAFWAMFLPADASKIIFGGQLMLLDKAGFIGFSLSAFDVFKYVALILITSLMFGTGSYFLITLLASTFGVFIAELILYLGNVIAKNAVYSIALQGNLGKIFIYSLLPFFGYLTLAFAGAIFAIGIIKYKFVEREFHQSLTDGMILTVLSIALLTAATLI
jgi:hypothetical protein